MLHAHPTSAGQPLRDAAASAPRVSVHATFDFLSADYRALFERSTATAFQHPLWLDAFYRLLAPARGAQGVVVIGRYAGSDKLVFVLPLILRRKSGILLLETTDLGVSDYAAPVVANGFVADDAVRAAIAAALPAHDLLRIRPVRSEAVGLWRAFLDASPRELGFSAHATALPATHALWRENAVDPSFARYLDKKKKRFFKAGNARLHLLSDPDDIRAGIEALQQDRAGRFDGDPIQQDIVRDFYADVAASGAECGLARTYALMIDDETAGRVFGLTHAGRFHYLLIGCDYERHGKHSPGLILYDTMIEDWIGDGGDSFDFTIGDEPFKKDFGAVPTAMCELVQAPTWRGRLARAAFHAREQLLRLRAARKAKQD